LSRSSRAAPCPHHDQFTKGRRFRQDEPEATNASFRRNKAKMSSEIKLRIRVNRSDAAARGILPALRSVLVEMDFLFGFLGKAA